MTDTANTASPAPLKDREIYTLDAPGITGMAPNALKRMQDHIDAGGSVIHRMQCHKSGVMYPVEPEKMWPKACK